MVSDIVLIVIIMKFKKIYIEITNKCNLDCDFCIKNNREKKFMSLEEYQLVLSNIKPFTNYVYLHLMGEPLLHPYINEIIDLTNQNKINVNITTNGYLIKRITGNKNIRQINISLHSFNEKYKLSLDEYLNNIYLSIENMPETIVNFRLWAGTKNYDNIINSLESRYNKKIIPNNLGNFKLDKNVFVSIKHEFEWPKIKEGGREILQPTSGTCLALKDHIGILSNLDVVACCLDSNGDINFGNLKHISLSEIIKSEKFNYIKTNLENNIKTEALCQNCNFYRK